MRQEIRREIAEINPLDQLEMDTITGVIHWVDSGAELFRLMKPGVPNKHLVSYFAVVDGEYLLY